MAENEIPSDVTYCNNFQVLTFDQLEKMISRSIGQEVQIADAGSSDQLGTYDVHGNHCVPQAIYCSLLHSGRIPHKTVGKVLDLAPKLRAGTMKGLTSVDLPKLLKIATKYNGIGMTSIRKSFSAASDMNLHLWTLERPDG